MYQVSGQVIASGAPPLHSWSSTSSQLGQSGLVRAVLSADVEVSPFFVPLVVFGTHAKRLAFALDVVGSVRGGVEAMGDVVVHDGVERVRQLLQHAVVRYQVADVLTSMMNSGNLVFLAFWVAELLSVDRTISMAQMGLPLASKPAMSARVLPLESRASVLTSARPLRRSNWWYPSWKLLKSLGFQVAGRCALEEAVHAVLFVRTPVVDVVHGSSSGRPAW